MVTFLKINGKALTYSPPDVVHTMRALASGSISDKDFIAWVRRAAGM
jgi:prophage maintenance system killer protein